VADSIPTDYYGGEMLLYQRRDLMALSQP
jgi:hypothetical protein